MAILCHFFATFVTSCTYRNEVQYLDTNDNKFDTDFTKDIFNWDQSLAIFGFSKVINIFGKMQVENRLSW